MVNPQPDCIRIGVLATLFGPFKTLGDDGVRGVKLAVAEVGGRIGDKAIDLEIVGTDATPDSAYYSAQSLLDNKGVDFIIGPLSGNEGLAVRDYARTRLDRTFINGTSGSQELTLRNPSPNFFNFSLDGAQWMAGLGTYAYQHGYRRVVTIGENYSFPHAQVGGFMVEFCRAGGRVVQKFWPAVGQKDFAAIIDAIPDNIDAIFVALGGGDAINFLQQYERVGKQKPLIGGAITTDQSVLSAEGISADYLIGVVAAGPTADDNPDPLWKSFAEAYTSTFPDAFNYPSLFANGYYVNAKAAMLGLQLVDGDLSDNQARFKASLTNLKYTGPCGPIRLDHNRQAISTNYVTEVAKNTQGKLYRKLIKAFPDVNQTLGVPEEEYLAIGSFTADNPDWK